MNKNGFAALAIILIAVVVLTAAGGIWYYETRQHSQPLSSTAPATNTGTVSSSSVSAPTPSSPTTTGTGLISAKNGGTITLASGNGVEIPAGAFDQDETVTASFSNEALPKGPNGYFIPIGNSFSLSLSDPLAALPVDSPKLAAVVQSNYVTSTMMKFTFSAGVDETEFNKYAMPTIEVIGTDNESFFVAFATSTFDTSTNQAIIYVDPAILQIPGAPTSTIRVKSIVVGLMEIGS
jgi:hypothetical protein